MTIKLLSNWGAQPAGTLYTTDATTEAAMVAAKVATSNLAGGVTWVPPGNSPGLGPPAHFSPDGRSLVDGDGIPFLRGAVLSGEWMTPPSIFRLRLTGTGTVVMDSRDSLGVETLAVESFTVSAATDQIEFPYAGDNAVAIRVTLTGTATAEVI